MDLPEEGQGNESSHSASSTNKENGYEISNNQSQSKLAASGSAEITKKRQNQFNMRQKKHMEKALVAAHEAFDAGEVPVGCVYIYPVNESNSSFLPEYVKSIMNGNGKKHESCQYYDEDTGDVVLMTSRNDTNAMCNATRHAELVALEEIRNPTTDSFDHIDLSKCEVYVTVEPCIMCASALREVGIGHVVFGCRNEKFGGCGSTDESHSSKLEYSSGLLEEEAIDLLRVFFARENSKTPYPNLRGTAMKKQRKENGS